MKLGKCGYMGNMRSLMYTLIGNIVMGIKIRGGGSNLEEKGKKDGQKNPKTLT